jgi:CRISPR system Cascade subunit CasC
LEAEGKSADEARAVATAALGSVGLALDKERTQYLVFLGRDQIDALAAACLAHWDALRAAAPTGDATGKAAKKSGKDAVPAEVATALAGVLDASKAADLALFGRMLADRPDKNVDAASQVAHAISTNRVSTEFDFFTAVDDLQPGEETGAGMMGTIEFNSACFYRYANVDAAQLTENLGGDTDLARQSLGPSSGPRSWRYPPASKTAWRRTTCRRLCLPWCVRAASKTWQTRSPGLPHPGATAT